MGYGVEHKGGIVGLLCYASLYATCWLMCVIDRLTEHPDDREEGVEVFRDCAAELAAR